MIDLTDPLAAYTSLREDHRRVVEMYFEDLVRQSGVDEELNRRTVADLRSLEQELEDVTRVIRQFRIVQALALLAAVALVVWAATARGAYLALLAVALGETIGVFALTKPHVLRAHDNRTNLGARRDARQAEAQAQMAPLNAAHIWDLAPRLVEEILPDVRFDGFLAAQTLARFHSDFGLSPEFTDDKSLTGLQSGTFRGNPFVVAQYVHHWIGSWTYTGSIVIRWTERSRDNNGEWVTVQRSETLTASVVKDHPFFATASIILYGHGAVPSLSFSRTSSRLSGLSDGTVNDWRKRRAVSSVERMARRATAKGTSGFTVMANTEFETLFRATDRDDEVGFRLLFTPLAQHNMVELLNDRTVGYGDDFSMAKAEKLSLVRPKHLESTELRPDPRIFASLSVDDARRLFQDFHVDYFKSLFFSFAPLWTVPLFGDAATTPPALDTGTRQVSTWDHEMVANRIGRAHFEHPASDTSSILKAESAYNPDGSSVVTIRAYGYEGFNRVDVIPVRGSDGNIHSVPVKWIEYLPRVNTSTMVVGPVDSSESSAQWEGTRQAYGPDLFHHRCGALVAALVD